tara:strand:+ start:265 stop:483 length:219 start_codon:yes stop_codon:yes gene_type:complete
MDNKMKTNVKAKIRKLYNVTVTGTVVDKFKASATSEDELRTRILNSQPVKAFNDVKIDLEEIELEEDENDLI